MPHPAGDVDAWIKLAVENKSSWKQLVKPVLTHFGSPALGPAEMVPCQVPSAARKHGFLSVGFWLQRLSWIKSVRCVWQTGDLVVGSESAFSVDKLHHKDTVLVWVVSRRDFLCYSQAGPARVSHVLVLFLCLRVGSLSPLFICSSDCTPGTVSLSPCICSLSVVDEPFPWATLPRFLWLMLSYLGLSCRWPSRRF